MAKQPRSFHLKEAGGKGRVARLLVHEQILSGARWVFICIGKTVRSNDARMCTCNNQRGVSWRIRTHAAVGELCSVRAPAPDQADSGLVEAAA